MSNFFGRTASLKAHRTAGGSCVFISYRAGRHDPASGDKDAARQVVRLLNSLGVAVYFDEEDAALQAANSGGNDAAVVRYIEEGLASCSHLLGIISNNTKKSWWVPWEMGNAKARTMQMSYLIREDVLELPAYMKIVRPLLGTDDLVSWVTAISRIIVEKADSSERMAAASAIRTFFPAQRTIIKYG
ncbi:MAG: toll/interleukin-1 receptor domain-containing protein [bacterium]